MQNGNQELSPKELAALRNADFFRQKANADEKIKALLVQLKDELEQSSRAFSGQIPEVLLRTNSRIYRGENYRGLPWRATDFPKSIFGEHYFLFRTLLIWGRHFSFHLILRGDWLDKYLDRLLDQLDALDEMGFWLSRQDSPWDWGFDEESHIKLKEMDAEAIRGKVSEIGFLKLSGKLELRRYAALPAEGRALWEQLLPILFEEDIS